MSDVRLYPQGSGGLKSRYVNDVLVEPGLPRFLRTRATIAQVNAGLTILPALPGYRYRMMDMAMIAIGGAVGAATAVVILGTRTTSVTLLSVAIAVLTQSALVRAGETSATILADGASFTQLDANTDVTVGKTGATATTATHVDFLVSYVVEP